MRDPAATDPGQDTAHFRRPMDDARLRIARLSPVKLELSEVFRQLCEIAADTLAVERAGIWLFVHHRTAIRCVCLFERTKRLISEGATLRVADFPNYFASLKVRKTVPAESAAHDPRTNELQAPYLAPLGITSLLDAPILIDGEMQGVVCHEHVGPVREWATEERDFAGSVADLVALKIKRAEIEKLRRIVRDLDTDRAAQRERESIASLAAGVAHDFRNLLVVINGFAEEITFDATAGSKTDQHAREIMATVERGTALTGELLAIARDQGGQPQVLDPCDHVTAFLPALQKAVGGRHTIDFKREPGIGRVFIEPSQLERIVMNLVLNARDAMTAGGTITVSLTDGQPPGNGHIMLAVSDTGGGIDPAFQERIFDPFFTTKPRDRGTGLGLTIVRQAVDRAGGDLRVENRPGQGATFRVQLPRVSCR